MNFRNKDWRNSMRLTVNYNYMMKKFKRRRRTRSITLRTTAAKA